MTTQQQKNPKKLSYQQENYSSQRRDIYRAGNATCDFCHKTKPNSHMISTKFQGKRICKLCWKRR